MLLLVVNDRATGLRKGLEDAFPNINIQSDVFHAIYKLSLDIATLEISAYNAINSSYDLETKCLKAFDRNRDKYLDKYEKVQIESNEAIVIYDRANILYQWIRDLHCINKTLLFRVVIFTSAILMISLS